MKVRCAVYGYKYIERDSASGDNGFLCDDNSQRNRNVGTIVSFLCDGNVHDDQYHFDGNTGHFVSSGASKVGNVNVEGALAISTIHFLCRIDEVDPNFRSSACRPSLNSVVVEKILFHIPLSFFLLFSDSFFAPVPLYYIKRSACNRISHFWYNGKQ